MITRCMSHHHNHHHDLAPAQVHGQSTYRRVLWLALLGNAGMALVELFSGWQADSVSLWADAIDFAGDSLNYALALWALGQSPRWRTRVGALKGWAMLAFGLGIMGQTLWHVRHGIQPQAFTMGWVAVLAMLINVSVAVLLYAWRDGDANMRAVWLCTRNDAIGNLAVLLAALGVWGTTSAWPDLLVGGLMALLAVQSGVLVLRQARAEIRQQQAQAPLD
jgi:Co/Zn/Cd efflux system component